MESNFTELDWMVNYMEWNLSELVWGTWVWGTASNGTIGYLHIVDSSNVAALDQAVVDLKDTEVMIIDCRDLGTTGEGSVVDIAAHFTNEPIMAFTRKALVGDGYSPVSEIYVKPNPDPILQYDGKIILITSEITPDIVPLTMAQLPQVTLLGHNSFGHFDGTYYELPNGWYFSVNNEVHRAPDGTSYEGTGVPPDILVETELMSLAEFEAGVDSWLELALKTAQQMIDDAANSTTGEDDEPSTTDPPEIPSGVSARATLHALATVASVAAATTFSL
jgi:C-terminal processing protease CtpA/Prc